MIQDQRQRKQALDPSCSFIVQAPAGSGKTTLLTQRFLVLLAKTPLAPEEVVAITFTRKAAAEMRARVISALHAANQAPPEEPSALQTWELARAVVKRDKIAHWKLLENPNRLRIYTIDALCTKIARSAPILSQFGSTLRIAENPEPYYRQAAHNLLLSINQDQPWVDYLETLLLHLDNQFQIAETLFIGMLSRRDQWLAHVVNQKTRKKAREVLEKTLKNILEDSLSKVVTHCSDEKIKELMSLLNFSRNILSQQKINTEITDLQFSFGNLEDNYKTWLNVADLLLTKDGKWRRTVNKNLGFPSGGEGNQDEKNLYKEMKQRMLKLLENVYTDDAFRNCLQEIRLLPPPVYSEKQWQIVQAMIELLPILVAYLQVIFQDNHLVDFISVSQGAIAALGDADNPTDLALNLDYRIKHLLVDEFQDTSKTQYRLIELLTAGWTHGDGRTLFLVGDPMQSIYRFREAEVGIFLHVRKRGIGSLKLEALTLTTNFRSQSGIVEWLNEHFVDIFPCAENIELGAIPFHPSSTLPTNNGGNVKVHPLLDKELETNYLMELLQQEQAINGDQSIAILVRSRNHLQRLIPQLKKAGVRFQAVEIERLLFSPVVTDLLALTKALCHLGDRTAWLSILRAPWCGLTLHDLYLLANHPSSTLYERLICHNEIKEISADGRRRLARVVPILAEAVNNRYRQKLRNHITFTWYKLGGPACLEEEFEQQHSNAYFEILESFENEIRFDLKQIEEKLYSTYINADMPNANIHLMTIHKAKGLEFDTVIIPGLEKRAAIDEHQLLLWFERLNNTGRSDLILAPIKSLEEEYDSIYRYIRTQNNLKSQHEITRLLYVAMTRAKKRLHLIGSIECDANSTEINDPPKGSFLKLLWKRISIHFEKINMQEKIQSLETQNPSLSLRRLCENWEYPSAIKLPILISASHKNRFSWSPEYLKQTGTVIHHYLQRLSQWDKDDWLDMLLIEKKKLTHTLLQHGVTSSYLQLSIQKIEKALDNIIQDEKAQWFLSKHAEARSEYPLTAYLNGEMQSIVIDRTFVDKDGYRWIIDYKTSDLQGEKPQEFLEAAQEKYKNQLEVYGNILQLMENRPIKLGLYFPLFRGWIEWELTKEQNVLRYFN